ncbi:phospholipid/cholesterol/gamma-HCH transport system substrate-binding protein [Mycolicibacterium rutilum]|uniref:Phospholipid/cholesterol/gamma-HCH transport system substrate-binding protein n=1 Tax=Mycolicibacterium rutilum TaxID=370526 RepID=A0A1H6JJS1_MYCRU|nr:MCE family protein [Mycolicibacterium rutilum]SEH62252.1 phospholipid/cholesterol/gamma-HCH transport system substrate-binding protein [Mycolicibacterium rutilum]
MPRTTAIRIAAAVLATVIVAFSAFTYLAYTAAFTPTDTVTVTSPRAGLVMDKEAKVKYRGIQIGKVEDITYSGDQAQLTLAINRAEMRYVPSNAQVRIASTTVFGAKSVEFLAPEQPSETSLRAGAVVQAEAVQLEANTLFQTLIDVLNKVNPIHLNATMTAIAEGLRGHGEESGSAAAGLNQFLAQLNPKLPTVESVLAQIATVANIYGDAGPDLVTVINNVPTISDVVVDEQENLNATLLAAIGLANEGSTTLEPAADDYIAAIQRLRAPLTVLGDYSPEFGCIVQGVAKGGERGAAVVGGMKPGAMVSSSFVLGVPSYTYPESLPIVNASGGPNCRGLPNIPSKQYGGSWYRAPFLVTDNAYIPYEPFTEVQVDAPSTFQFLFNGAFAERDDF